MERDPTTTNMDNPRPLRFLFAAYAYLWSGYLGLALAAVGLDWTLAAQPEPGPFVSVPLAFAGATVAILAWHSLYRLYAADANCTEPDPPSVQTPPTLASARGAGSAVPQ